MTQPETPAKAPAETFEECTDLDSIAAQVIRRTVPDQSGLADIRVLRARHAAVCSIPRGGEA